MAGIAKALKGIVKSGAEVSQDVLDAILSAPDTVNMPSLSKPEYRGAAPDRSNMTYLRYNPKAPSERVARSLAILSDPANPVRADMMADIDRGIELGGNDWYNTEELRDWFKHYLGDDRGDEEWRGFMSLVGSTSPNSKVDPNIGNASAVRNRMATSPEYVDALSQVQGLADANPLGRTRQKGYGHKAQGLQELVTARQLQGAWEGMPEPGMPASKGSWAQNPKPKGFTNSLLGNQRNIAADLHFTRYMAMASKHPDWLENTADVSNEFAEALMARNPASKKYFKFRDTGKKGEQYVFSPKKAVKSGDVGLDEIAEYPSIWASKPNDNEYGAFEDFIAQIGKERGMTPAQVQAALWMGAADRTGVDEGSQKIFMDVLRDRADRRAAATKRTREEVIRDFIVNKGLLAVPAAGAVGLGAASQQPMSPEDEMIQYLKQIEAQYR